MAKKSVQSNRILIEESIIVLRGSQVMLDEELAALYGVTTKTLNQAVKRNLSRFPADFMFRLTATEFKSLRSQFVTSNDEPTSKQKSANEVLVDKVRGGRRYPPYAFTEQGVAMLSSVLRSSRAVQVNIEIMRAFVRLRTVIALNADLARKLAEIEKRLEGHDDQFVHVIRAIRQLMEPVASPPRRPIGFHTNKGSR